MKKMIVNADDLGLTPGVTQGIIYAHQNGIVSSASALMNTPHISVDLPHARHACPNLGIGVHLVITEGKPLMPASRVPSLTNEKGKFHKFHHQPAKIQELDLAEVRAEWQAQINCFFEFGFPPDHLDNHHHISYFNSDLFEVFLELASEYGLPVRYPPPEYFNILGRGKINQSIANLKVTTPGACNTSFYGKDNTVSLENMMLIMTELGDEPQEVMCHPGYADQELIERCSYSTPRENEIEILTHQDILLAIKEQEISLINYSGLAGNQS